MRRRTPSAFTLAALAAALWACQSQGPAVGEKKVPIEPPPPEPPRILVVALVTAGVGDAATPWVDFRLTLGGESVAPADLATLKPTFTLAELTTDPDSGLPAWRSQLATGSQTVPEAPLGGPGTGTQPAHKQPGSESTGAVEDRGDGVFRYTFANPLLDPLAGTHTYRMGVWLNGAAGTADTCKTLDFVPDGGTPAPRDLVADQDCQRCHAQVLAHGRRVGVKLCTTCHTYQAADPDTADPAAPLAATPATNPNPVDLGRLVHRIHRGKTLPTLYQASSTTAAPALGSGTLPLPFSPSRNTPVAGRSFGVVGYSSHLYTFGEVKTWTAPGQPDRTVAGGVTFPRDLRDCLACHEHGAQGGVSGQQYTTVSRRTCGGCHPDVWFGAGAPPDGAHFAHPGGPQVDDALCAQCHVAGAAATLPQKLYVDVKDAHTAIVDAAPFSKITATIVSVSGFLPGAGEPGATPDDPGLPFPTVKFRLEDRSGPISPLNDAANPPPPDAQTSAPSPVSRWPAGSAHRLAFVIAGPTSPDFATGNVAGGTTLTETVADVLTADVDGVFTYTFKAVKVPRTATGAWAVALEARRQLTPRSPFYTAATDTFSWPYTAEALTEHSTNPIAYVDVYSGSTDTGPALARRTVVTAARCLTCHKELLLHGGNRTNLAGCVVCHAPDQSDWGRRPKDASGNVLTSATYDGVEERSVHFKMMIHRIHTGGRKGSAQIDLEPLVVYGFGGTPVFFEEVFPNDLRNCRLCHEGESFLLENIPAGAASTVVNENASVLHKGTAGHGGSEPRIPPMTAACTSCHDTGTARLHASGKVVDGVEGCVGCHGASGEKSVYTLHGLTPPAP